MLLSFDKTSSQSTAKTGDSDVLDVFKATPDQPDVLPNPEKYNRTVLKYTLLSWDKVILLGPNVISQTKAEHQGPDGSTLEDLI